MSVGGGGGGGGGVGRLTDWVAGERAGYLGVQRMLESQKRVEVGGRGGTEVEVEAVIQVVVMPKPGVRKRAQGKDHLGRVVDKPTTGVSS